VAACPALDGEVSFPHVRVSQKWSPSRAFVPLCGGQSTAFTRKAHGAGLIPRMWGLVGKPPGLGGKERVPRRGLATLRKKA